MKRTIAIVISVILVLALSACGNVKYTTKYVVNTPTLDIREAPKNEASIVCTVSEGTAVSFENDAENGYSKVVYNGVTGYALSAYLTLEKPEFESVPAKPSNKNVPNTTKAPSKNIANDVEEYVTDFVRPLYNSVNQNLDKYTMAENDGITAWFDDQGCIKKSIKNGINGVGYSREYYYDTDSGRIAFAFVFDGTIEYRLYFRLNQLVRYIGPDGVTVDNPDLAEAAEMGELVLTEAY